jgi:hypothetical protein
VEDQRTGSDCLRCCVASVLGLSWSEVPDFVKLHGVEWDVPLSEWARDRGIEVVRVRCTSDGEMLPTAGRGTWIATGSTTRGTSHAVVYRGTEMVHDPHESREGLEEITGAVFLSAGVQGS